MGKSMIVPDTNSDCTNAVKVLGQWGVGIVGRYYSTTHPGYALTKDEAVALSAGGIKIFTIFEDTGNPNVTNSQGQTDGTAALRQA